MRCLDDLASRIDEAEEQAHRDAWRRFVNDQIGAGVFVPLSRTPRPPRVDWPDIHCNDALHDPQLMLLQQFGGVSNLLANGSGAGLGVRCNYGVSIMTSQFGCEVVEMPRSQHNTPTTMALGCDEAIDAAIDRGVPDLRAGQGGDVFDAGELFLEAFRRWPVLGRWVSLYHPDAQGPMDNAELAYGSEIFLAFYDCPERVHAFLELMTEHYLAFMRKWFELVPTPNDMTLHWRFYIPGRVMLRDDSLMNLSSEIYVQFIREREARCLRELGGGAIHFCGRGDHFIEAMSEIDSLQAVHMSQPHLNDTETIFQHTVDKGLKLMDLAADAAAAAATAGRDLRGRAHCARSPG